VEGLYSATLIVTHCNDCTVTVFRTYKAAAVLSALMKVYTIPCYDRGHIHVMIVLQSCTDPLHILPSSSSVIYATSCNINNVKVEEDIDIKKECFIPINEEMDLGIKQEEIPEDITFPDVNPEPDEVSYVCMSVTRHLLPVSGNVSCFCDATIFGQFEQLYF